MNEKSPSLKWSEFRFSVVGSLLSSPPIQGELKKCFKELAAKKWKHPTTGEERTFHWSTIERWYYKAKKEKLNPVEALQKQVRSDKCRSRVLTEEVKKIILDRYSEYRYWSYQLHQDNLVVDLKKRGIEAIPSYSTVRRFLQTQGKYKTRKSNNNNKKGYQKALQRLDTHEVRSYENEYVNGLWHLDFHHGSRQVVTSTGEIVTPICLAVIDDHSRLLCHIQWYLNEKASDLVHGFNQALQKRGIPRSLMTDNGGAMTSAEFTEGLFRLGIIHEKTLPYSPYQNGKQEVLWGQVEGRLLAMLGNKKIVKLKELNDITQAWCEIEYNKATHGEIRSTPLNRFLNHSDVSRDCPSLDYLRSAFRREESRRIRKSDGTILIEGKRFEIPYQYRHFKRIRVQYAKWDLSFVHVIDDNSKLLARIYPVDKAFNSRGHRKKISEPSEVIKAPEDSLPPLLEHIVSEYEKMGVPPAYIPKDQ